MVDLRPGPMVVETPLQALGMFDDWGDGSESSISACRARIAARAAGSCSSRRATSILSTRRDR
jgi:hypothetical protein